MTVVLLEITASVLLAIGFVAVFRENQMRTPWFYWTWGTVATLVLSVLVVMPSYITVANFAFMLAAAFMWNKEEKGEAG